MPNQRFNMLKQVLVSQEKSGLHHGGEWRPRASTQDITDASTKLDADQASNPANLNGDHVLVGFIDGSFNTPVVLRSIPHPSNDIGNDDKELGQRLKLKVVDGDPYFQKHHGSFFGVSDDGDFIADTTFANEGSTDAEGIEPDPPIDGKGSQSFKLPQDGTYKIQLLDMSNPSSPSVVNEVVITKDKIKLGSDSAGDQASLDSKVQTELTRIATELKALTIVFNTHTSLDTYIFPLIPLPAPPVPVAPVAPLPQALTPADPAVTKSGLVDIDS
jgi:hypothetical protein